MIKLNKIFLIVLIIIVSSCRVYEDDTFISIRNPKQRIIGIWQLDKVESKGEDYSEAYFEINKSQKIEYFYNETFENYLDDSLASFGIWSIEGESENIISLQPINEWENKIFTISRMQKNNLWLIGYDEYFLDSLLYMYSRIE